MMKLKEIAFTLFVFLFLTTLSLAGVAQETGKKQAKSQFKRHVDLRKFQAAFNESSETENVKTYTYSKNRIYKIPLREYMRTVIRLPENESILEPAVLGDSVNFQFNRINNNTFEVWGIHPGADSNLTVLGSSNNIYTFYLKNYSVKSPQLPDLTVYINGIIKPQPLSTKEELPKQAEKLSVDYLRTLTQTDPTTHNFNYEICKGDKKLSPLRVFDDGLFTYFQFSEKNLDNTELPEIYAVIDGYETPTQKQLKNGFVIVTSTNDKWTIRNGERFLCVRRTNE